MLINKPYSAQIELVRGCNMKCGFCGNFSLPDEKKFMTEDTIIKILMGLKQFGGKIRIQFSMRGEPTLHQEWHAMIGITRIILPKSQIMLTTNGIKLNTLDAFGFFQRGGNILQVDCYEKTLEKYVSRFKTIPVKKYVFPDDNFSPWTYKSPSLQCILFTRDLKEYSALQRTFTNQCGAIDPAAYKKYGINKVINPFCKSCTNPFRELVFHYNGDMPICCKDWRGQRVLNNINNLFGKEDNLVKYWEGDLKLNTIRTLLYNKNREFTPCNNCNFNGGFYKGFLPKMDTLDSKARRKAIRYLE